MKTFVLTYKAVPDMMIRRDAVRPEHLALAQAEVAAGRMVLGGAFVGDPPGSMIIFRGEDDSGARQFAERDPYVTTGLITEWDVREWNVVLGPIDTL